MADRPLRRRRHGSGNAASVPWSGNNYTGYTHGAEHPLKDPPDYGPALASAPSPTIGIGSLAISADSSASASRCADRRRSCGRQRAARPALGGSFRSHSGSHRWQILSEAARRAQTIRPAKCLTARCQATHRDASGVPSKPDRRGGRAALRIRCVAAGCRLARVAAAPWRGCGQARREG
jgi:hypothetical protein